MSNLSNTASNYICDSHWLIVRHDFKTRSSRALPKCYLNQYEALHALEKHVRDFVTNQDGKDTADPTPHQEVKIVYVCQKNLRDPGMTSMRTSSKRIDHDGSVMTDPQIKNIHWWRPNATTMEKTFVDQRWASRDSRAWLPYGHYVTRCPSEHVSKLTVWKKEQVTASGVLLSGEDRCSPVFSVELVEILNQTYNNLLVEDEQAMSEYDDRIPDAEARAREARLAAQISEDYRQILIKTLPFTETFAALGARFQVEPTSVADFDVGVSADSSKSSSPKSDDTPTSDPKARVSSRNPGVPTRDMLAKLNREFYHSNVDSGNVLSIRALRHDHPDDFVVWQCAGKSSGGWVPFSLRTTDIVVDGPEPMDIGSSLKE